MGRTHRILTESPRTGRTEQFTEVAFSADQPEGRIVTATITGQAAGNLLA
jgi:threonylcarbamoyladenosine tRNA methylthiotransferase MtaB